YDLTETPPYGPWHELFALADETSPLDADGAAPGSQEALFARVRGTLARWSAARPLLLVLDDCHWADLASLELLRDLARHVASLPPPFVVIYRSNETTRRHPLYRLLPALVRESGATRLDLRPLDDAAVTALVRARYTLSRVDTERLVEHIQARAEGN